MKKIRIKNKKIVGTMIYILIVLVIGISWFNMFFEFNPMEPDMNALSVFSCLFLGFSVGLSVYKIFDIYMIDFIN